MNKAERSYPSTVVLPRFEILSHILMMADERVPSGTDTAVENSKIKIKPLIQRVT